MNYEPLIKTLTDELDIYSEVLELEKKKTVAIVDGDVESLDSTLATEQILSMKINNAEKRRMGVIDGLGLNSKTLLDVVKSANNPDKTKLFRLRQKLIEIIKTIKEINEYNAILIKSRLGVMTDITDFLYGLENKKPDQNTTYNKKAVVNEQTDSGIKIKKKI